MSTGMYDNLCEILKKKRLNQLDFLAVDFLATVDFLAVDFLATVDFLAVDFLAVRTIVFWPSNLDYTPRCK